MEKGQHKKNNYRSAPVKQTTKSVLQGQCPVYRKCSGCQLQNMSYNEQLAHKQRTVTRLLSNFCKVSPIVGMSSPLHYRNKVQTAFTTSKGRKTIAGVYQSSTGGVVATPECMIESRQAGQIAKTIEKLMPDLKIFPYDNYSGKGHIRHLLIRHAKNTGQIMVVVVTKGAILPAKNNFVKALLKKHSDITTIVHNISPHKTNLVLGKRSITLYGKGYIEDVLCGLRFRISPHSFYQVNSMQTELLYNKAMEYADLRGSERVIDAYCGIGTIGMIAAKHSSEVLGVENNRDAVRDAIANAGANDIKNIRFECADAGEFLTDMANDGESADVVFLDPPRAGSDRKFLQSLLTLAPKKIVYVSCNPETLARDLKVLSGEYKVRAVTPFDMFPYTSHIECVVSLAHRGNNP